MAKKQPSKQAGKTAKTNPYETLGVDRSASSEEITKAYRRRAMKSHPDRESGDAEAFRETEAAYQVLIDPDRRKKFDQTGSIDQPENHALNWVSKALCEIISEAFSTGKDLEKIEIMKFVRSKLNSQQTKLRAQVKENRQGAEKLRKVAERFSVDDGENILKKIALQPVIEAERQIRHDEEVIDQLIRALEIVSHYEYRHDQSSPVRATSSMIWASFSS